VHGSIVKILHIIPSVAASDGGPAKAVVEMCRDANRRGAEAEIYTTNLDGHGTHQEPCGTPIAVGGVRITYFPVTASIFYKISPGLAAALRKKIPECDVVHIHSLYQFPSTAAAYYSRKFGVPYILRPHGTLDPYLYQRHRGRKWLYELIFERRNLRDAAAVHFITKDEMLLARESGLQFNPVVVPFGVELETTPRHRDRTAMELMWPEMAGKEIILFLGRVNFKKGLDILARAFGQIGRVRNDVILVIAGPDIEGYGAQVRAWLADEGVADKTIFTGMLTGERKEAILAGASTFALPSYTENFGIAIVEAMAAGIPVVVSRAVNICESVRLFEAGFVVSHSPDELALALQRLLDDPALAQRTGDGGKRLVQELFTWEAAGSKLMELYSEVASQSVRGIAML
jgi:glycosyltransferase involved in cell wall biosynthesis